MREGEGIDAAGEASKRVEAVDAASLVLAATLRLAGVTRGEAQGADQCSEAIACVSHLLGPAGEEPLIARTRALASLRHADGLLDATPTEAIAQRLFESSSLVQALGDPGATELVFDACVLITAGPDATDLRALLAVALGLEGRLDEVLTEHEESGGDDCDPARVFMSGTTDEVLHALSRLPASSGIETWLTIGALVPPQTPLMLAAMANPNPEVVEVLCRAGADVNASDDNGRTALMNAASMNENPRVIHALLAAGADIHAVNAFGFTALIVAAIKNPNLDVHEALIAAGATVDAVSTDADQATALLFACEGNSNPGVIRVLLDAGADPRRTTRDGRSASALIRANQSLRGTDAEAALAALGLE